MGHTLRRWFVAGLLVSLLFRNTRIPSVAALALLAGYVGFQAVQKEKAIIIPDDILAQYLSAEQITAFKNSGTGIRSVTVYAEKPLEEKACCGPDCCN